MTNDVNQRLTTLVSMDAAIIPEDTSRHFSFAGGADGLSCPTGTGHDRLPPHEAVRHLPRLLGTAWDVQLRTDSWSSTERTEYQHKVHPK